MVFLKFLGDLEFADIEELKTNKICESQILDYKQQLLEDAKLLKQVCAFANTQGGFLVFGVKETGKGGYPREIPGVYKDKINSERIEQTILGNIQPRLNVKIRIIDHEDPLKAIVIIQIPNSYLKPHMDSRSKRFYKRYESEALPMTELEVNDAYKRRFTGYQEVESYISRLLEPKVPFRANQVIGQIILMPTISKGASMVDTSSVREFDWMNRLGLKPKNRYIPSSPNPSPNGVRCQLGEDHTNGFMWFEIHRNGCIHYKADFGALKDTTRLFLDVLFCIKLLQTLQFGSILYRRYNYFGGIKIICDIRSLAGSLLLRHERIFRLYRSYPCQVEQIRISREFPVTVLESKYEYVTSGIMNDIFNCYGLWKYPLFDEEGNLKESLLKDIF